MGSPATLPTAQARWAARVPILPPEVLASTARSPDTAPLVSSKADVWSTGVVFYEALVGTTSGVTAEDAVAWRGEGAWQPPALSADIPPAFGELLRLMLTVDQSARPDCSKLLEHPAVMQLKQLVPDRGFALAQLAQPVPLPSVPPHPDFVIGRVDEPSHAPQIYADHAGYTRIYSQELRRVYLRTQRLLEERSDSLAYITPRLCNAVLDPTTAAQYLDDQRTKLGATVAVIEEMALRVDTLRCALEVRRVPVLLAFADNAFSREFSGARDSLEKQRVVAKYSYVLEQATQDGSPLSVAIFKADDGQFEGVSLAYIKTPTEEVVASANQVQASPQGAFNHVISSSVTEVARVRGQVQALRDIARDTHALTELLQLVRRTGADLQFAAISALEARCQEGDASGRLQY